MKELFSDIYRNEKNEHTAFVLMLGVLSEKQTEIINELKLSNKLMEKLLSHIKEDIDCSSTPLSREDYME